MTRDSVDVLAMLDRCGRARRRRGAAEAAGATGVAGCLAAGAVAGAMGVQAGYRAAALGLAAAPLAMGAVVATVRGLRRRVRPAGPVAAVLGVSGLLGVAAVLTGQVDRIALTAAMVAGAMLAGALPVLVRRVDVSGTARLLDERGGFAERLATAAQVAPRADEDAAAAMVCRQGAAILRFGRGDRVSLWTRTPATPAALTVAGLVWVIVLLLPPIGPEEWAGVDVAAMTSQEKAQWLGKIQALAAGTKGAAAARLPELPAAVQAGDRETVAKILEELRRAGVDVRAAARAIAERGSGGSEGGGMRNRKPLEERTGATGATGGAGRVAWVGPGSVGVQEGPDLGAGVTMPYDVAWHRAGVRAAAALDGGTVPARYSQLVRDFFGVGGR